MGVMRGGAPNAFLLASFIRRLNDWVPQVRWAARSFLPRLTEQTPTDIIVDVLWELLPAQVMWGRIEDAERKALIDMLSADDVAENLARKIERTSHGPASVVLAQAGRNAALDRHLPDIAATAIQPAVRAKAVQALLDREMIWSEGRKWVWTDKAYCKGRYEPVLGRRSLSSSPALLDNLRKAVADKSPAVRRVAGDALIRARQALGADGVFLARQLVDDAYPSIAERGRYVLDNP
ncbi:MAG: hypothetical protein MI723_19470 [Caulobacterales bacterium]|nr:hypothetical protein [Caulobacterales bacterium]